MFGMTQSFSPTLILRKLRKGPGQEDPPTEHQVKVSAERFPDNYGLVLAQLFYEMVNDQFKTPGKNRVTQYKHFVEGWRNGPKGEMTQFFIGSVDAYHEAAKGRFFELDWEDPQRAPALAKRLKNAMPDESTIEGLAWMVLLGQFQSTYSREEAADTFAKVQQHAHASLVAEYFWDTGALTYYSDVHVKQHRRELPSLSAMRSSTTGGSVGSDHAIAISMDPNFFRIYGPMVFFNAQQLPDQDFVIILCAPEEEAQKLYISAEVFLAGLTEMNRQPGPSNVRIHAVDTPDWVGSERTFYACARFLAIPELLEEYQGVYAMDADLFLMRDPKQFISRVSRYPVSYPKTKGLLGVPPWRRFMAGSFVANRSATDTKILGRVFDYLSVGLSASQSWMLDQNALSYGAEGAAKGEYTPTTAARPARVGPIMSKWERNYKAAKE